MAQIRGKQIADKSLDAKKLQSSIIPADVTLGSAKTVTDLELEVASTLVTKAFTEKKVADEQSRAEGVESDLQSQIETLASDTSTALSSADGAGLKFVDGKFDVQIGAGLEITADDAELVQIKESGVVESMIANNSVTTDKIAAGAVLDSKIDTVSASKAKLTPIIGVVANDVQAAITELNTDIEAIVSSKGMANGIAPLGTDAKISEAFLPDSIVGQVEYMGVYDMANGTEPAVAEPANKGHYYIIGVAGSRAGFVKHDSDDNEFNVGDWIISDGIKWSKVDNSDAVATVHGRNGNIVAVKGDYTADLITVSGVDTIGSDNLQGALQELVADIADAKSTASGSLSDADGAGLLWNTTSKKFDVQVDAGLEIANDKVQIKNGGVTNDMLGGSISDDKLNTITATGKVANSATTANDGFQAYLDYFIRQTAENFDAANTIVVRDSSGNASFAGVNTWEFETHNLNAKSVSITEGYDEIILNQGAISASKSISTPSVSATTSVSTPLVTGLETPTADSDATNKAYVDSKVANGALNGAVEFESKAGKAMGTGIQEYFVSVSGDTTFVASKTDAKVFVNGIRINMTQGAFFSNDGIAKRTKPEAGDKLYFDTTVVGYEIEANIDLVQVSYFN
jgi:hypothetical protein